MVLQFDPTQVPQSTVRLKSSTADVSPPNWTQITQFPLELQANPQRESSVYSKKRLTFSGRFLL